MLEMTTLPTEELDRLARALRAARERREPMAPLTEGLPDLSVADAYAVAERNVAARVAGGAAVVGHKIGLTSPTVQAQLGGRPARLRGAARRDGDRRPGDRRRRRTGEPLIFHSGAYRRLIASPLDPTRTEEWAGDLHTWRLGGGHWEGG
jgi:hypothetical protein